MVIELQDCHHDLTAFAAMTSVRNDGPSDVTSAYERAIAREEKGVNSTGRNLFIPTPMASLAVDPALPFDDKDEEADRRAKRKAEKQRRRKNNTLAQYQERQRERQ